MQMPAPETEVKTAAAYWSFDKRPLISSMSPDRSSMSMPIRPDLVIKDWSVCPENVPAIRMPGRLALSSRRFALLVSARMASAAAW